MAKELKPCGTPAAYARHKRAGEKPCEPCEQANRERARAGRKSGPTNVVEDVATSRATRNVARDPAAPEFDSDSARELWDETTAAFDLSRHEKLILESLCREQDIIVALTAGLRGAPLMSTGSMGQDVANPLLGEVRQHRAAFTALLKALALPDAEQPDGAEANPRAASARAAAQSRWSV